MLITNKVVVAAAVEVVDITPNPHEPPPPLPHYFKLSINTFHSNALITIFKSVVYVT